MEPCAIQQSDRIYIYLFKNILITQGEGKMSTCFKALMGNVGFLPGGQGLGFALPLGQ